MVKPLSNLFHQLMPKRMRSNAPEVWSFFTGAMGLDLGLESAGIHTTLAVEIDEACCRTMRHNCPALDVWQTDIRATDATELRHRRSVSGDVWLMAGGPPCQSFCPGGKRAALSDPRGNLIYTYLALISQVRPRYLLLENVANLVTAAINHRPIAHRPGKKWNLSSYSKGGSHGEDAAPMGPDELSGSAIRQVFLEMEQLGYSLNFAVLDAADYGAAQHRLRFIMLGSRQGACPPLPDPTHGSRSPANAPWRSVREVIFHLRDCPGPHSQYTPGVARTFERVPPGGNWRSLPRDLQRKALGEASFAAGGGKTGFFRRLSWDAPSPTITGRANRKGSALCHPELTRPLSVRECARLQGFPDDWQFSGSMSEQYMQVGNAVPVPLGAAVGRAILANDCMTGMKQQAGNLDLMLARATARLRQSARNKTTRRDEDSPQLELFASGEVPA